jgi:hypothetical protein
MSGSGDGIALLELAFVEDIQTFTCNLPTYLSHQYIDYRPISSPLTSSPKSPSYFRSQFTCFQRQQRPLNNKYLL